VCLDAFLFHPDHIAKSVVGRVGRVLRNFLCCCVKLCYIPLNCLDCGVHEWVIGKSGSSTGGFECGRSFFVGRVESWESPRSKCLFPSKLDPSTFSSAKRAVPKIIGYQKCIMLTTTPPCKFGNHLKIQRWWTRHHRVVRKQEN
jgi:hypothetical protein